MADEHSVGGGFKFGVGLYLAYILITCFLCVSCMVICFASTLIFHPTLPTIDVNQYLNQYFRDFTTLPIPPQ